MFVVLRTLSYMVYSKNKNRSRVGVVAITLASHARGREFEPRIRYFSVFFFYCYSRFLSFQKMGVVSTHNESRQ